MKKYKLYIILIIGFVLAVLGFFVLLKHGSTSTIGNSPATSTTVIGDGWSRYEDKSVGLSFEYPSRQLPAVHYPPGYIIFQAPDSGFDNAGSPAISAGTPLGVGSLHSLEELLDIEANGGEATDAPPNHISITKAFPSIRYRTVDGTTIAMTNDYGTTTISESNVSTYFLVNGLPYTIDIYDLSPADTQRVWQSIRFLKQ